MARRWCVGAAVVLAAGLSSCLVSPKLVPGGISLLGNSKVIAPEGIQPSVVETPDVGQSDEFRSTVDEPYYPLRRFFSWVYSVSIDGEGIVTTGDDIVRVKTLTDTPSSRIGLISHDRSFSGTRVQKSVAFSNSLSDITISEDGETRRLQLPLRPGRDWTSGELVAKCSRSDSLTTVYGIYSDIIMIRFMEGNDAIRTEWLSRGIGVVKYMRYFRIGPSRGREEGVLMNYRVVPVASVEITPEVPLLLMTEQESARVSASAILEGGNYSAELTLTVDPPGVASLATTGSSGGRWNGIVVAVGTGSATITARSDQDPTKVATLSIIVN